MGYSYYCPLVAFGFREIAHRKILSYDGNYVQVYATEVNKGYICRAFIGIRCRLDSDGKLVYQPGHYDELLKVVEKYKAYHNITDDIKLGYAPVLSGDLETEDSYYSLPDDNDEEEGEECEK